MIGFSEFIEAIHEPLADGSARRPYPWQVRFAAALASENARDAAAQLWITAPTGAGKTTAVDAAVWALASQADRAPVDRTVGVRLVWTIDRRILVDEVHRHAEALADKLEAALDDDAHPLYGTAVRLLALAAEGRWQSAFDPTAARKAGFRPLVAGRWRGGVPTRLDHRSPFQPTVISSTVQQVGSRLLFRGYGVSLRSRSVEAALVARDAMVFLDEAHLAGPFSDTVKAVTAFQETHPTQGVTLPRPLRLVTLTATPPRRATGPTFGIDDEDRARPELLQRLTAAKQLRTVTPDPKPAEQLADLALAAVSESGAGEPPIVAIVANKVKTATDALARVRKQLGKREDVDTVLLVGPQRPADRRKELDRVAPWLFGGKVPPRPLVVVATQTFEVGLDADVGHLITQSASASALVQRMGRVNRAGLRPASMVTVVRDEGFPLYADDEPAAWEWLRMIEADGGDVSVQALTGRLADDERPEQKSPPSAPSLTDAIVQQLAQTSEALPPWNEPDVDGLLRGAETEVARDVSVVWRSDITWRSAATRDLLKLAPPQPDESITLSISRVREMIAAAGGVHGRILDQSDVASAGPSQKGDFHAIEHAFAVVRGRDVLVGRRVVSDPLRELSPQQIMPGDTVVLPLEAGGLATEGGAQRLATDCRLELLLPAPGAPGVPFVRVTREVLLGVDASDQAWAACVRSVRSLLAPSDGEAAPASPAAAPRRAEDWVGALSAHVVDEDDRAALVMTLGDDDWAARPLDRPPTGDAGDVPPEQALGWVLRRVQRDRDGEDPAYVGGDAPLLVDHCDAVAERAGRWADVLGTSQAVAGAVRLAGQAHDLGKSDPRTQAFFAGGVRRLGQSDRAKSVFGTRDPVRSRAARHRAGLPSSLRHEVASVAALADWLGGEGRSATSGIDPDLALHLVGTHHGWGRPAFPVPIGGTPPWPFRANAGSVRGRAVGDGEDGWQNGEWDQRFWRLHDELGPWALAYLETLVRLADRTISEEGR